MADHYKTVKTQEYQFRAAFGSNQPNHADERHLIKFTGGYTVLDKQVATASTTAVHAAITASSSATTTTTTGFTNPDVPRNITITTGGTSGDINESIVTVTGTNIEGKTITERFTITENTAETITGTKAFATVTQISIPTQDGADATFAVGTGNALGVQHRLNPRKTTAYVLYDTGSGGATVDAAPTVATHETLLENNTITPVATPNASRRYRLYYFTHHVSVGDLNDNPVWSTSTSTTSSTSTSSTSTSSTSTSTSSTSSSTSSTSSSTSTSSTSTSSTSTSTAP